MGGIGRGYKSAEAASAVSVLTVEDAVRPRRIQCCRTATAVGSQQTCHMRSNVGQCEPAQLRLQLLKLSERPGKNFEIMFNKIIWLPVVNLCDA